MASFITNLWSNTSKQVWGMMQEEFEERTDPMAMVFPKVVVTLLVMVISKKKDGLWSPHTQMAKCTFHKYGPTGTIQRHDGLCILPVGTNYTYLWLLCSLDMARWTSSTRRFTFSSGSGLSHLPSSLVFSRCGATFWAQDWGTSPKTKSSFF